MLELLDLCMQSISPLSSDGSILVASEWVCGFNPHPVSILTFSSMKSETDIIILCVISFTLWFMGTLGALTAAYFFGVEEMKLLIGWLFLVQSLSFVFHGLYFLSEMTGTKR